MADDDGVCIVERTNVEVALSGAENRVEKEEDVRQRVAKGEFGLDIYHMREKLAAAGLEYVE